MSLFPAAEYDRIDAAKKHFSQMINAHETIVAMWRVLHRVGFVQWKGGPEERSAEFDALLTRLPRPLPGDWSRLRQDEFKMALYNVGVKHCFDENPSCDDCPFLHVCDCARGTGQWQISYARDGSGGTEDVSHYYPDRSDYFSEASYGAAISAWADPEGNPGEMLVGMTPAARARLGIELSASARPAQALQRDDSHEP